MSRTATIIRRARLLAIVGGLAVLAVLAMGAKCVENTSVYVDDEGYTHIAGQMFNETDIQGRALMLRGTLYDANNNVIATKDAATCPPDLAPHSQVMFDIRFDNPGIPPHARYAVQAISGQAQDAQLTDPDVVVLGTDAIGFEGIPDIPGLGLSDEDVFFSFDIRNRSATTYVGAQGCAVAYDNAGNVVAANQDELIQLDQNGFPHPAVLGNQFRTSVFMSLDEVPRSAAVVRAWIWFGNKADTTSQYRYIMTPPITIQTQTFP